MPIGYQDKVNAQSSALPEINKVTDANLNEIKNEHNGLELTVQQIQTNLNALADISGLVPFLYSFDSETFEDNPSAGNIRINTSSPVSATEIYVSASDANFVVEKAWDRMQVGALLYIKARDNNTLGGFFEVTAYTKNGSTWYKLGVTALDGSGAIPDGTQLALFLIPPAAASGSGEANTSSNAGAGTAQIAKAKSGVDLPFKSFLADGLSISNGTNELTFTVREGYFYGIAQRGNIVAATHNIDWDIFSLYDLVLTQNCAFVDVNLPASGSKTAEMIISGDFTLTFPAYWVALPSNDAYDGTKRNHIVVSVIDGGSGTEDVIYSLETLA